MKLLQSIATHFLLAFPCFVIGGALLWDVVIAIVPSGIALPDLWIWAVWGGISVVLGYSIPGVIARRRVRFWINRLSSPRRNVSWEQGCRTVLSWLDSPLLWPWEQDRIAFDGLQEIEPYLRSEMPGETPHRNLLKLLTRHAQADDQYRELLVESYLSHGIDDLNDAALIADLWNEHPSEKLGGMWIDFALAQKIDAPWMDKGYRWAMERGGKAEEEVTRFLLPRLLSRNRHDDLAALVYLKGNRLEPSPEVTRALLKIAQHHFKTSRDDELVMRVRDAVADAAEEERVEPAEEEIPLEELIARVKPTFGGFVWREMRSMSRAILPVLGAALKALFSAIRVLFRLVWNLLENIKLPPNTKRWLYPIGIGVLLVIVGWGIIKIIPSHAPKTVSPDRGGLKVYHSDLPFTVQVAAFRTQAEAETMTLRLRHSGEEAYWQKSEGDKPWFRVRLGGFQSQDDAKKHAEALVSRKLIDNYYVANFIDGYYSIP